MPQEEPHTNVGPLPVVLGRGATGRSMAAMRPSHQERWRRQIITSYTIRLSDSVPDTILPGQLLHYRSAAGRRFGGHLVQHWRQTHPTDHVAKRGRAAQ